ETQRFFSGKILVKIRIFGEKTDRFAAFHETTVAPKNFRSPARWGNQPENYFEGCAFAGTIRSEQPVHFAQFDAKVEVLHGDNRASGMQGNRKYFRYSGTRDCWPRLRAATARRVSHGEFQSR